MYYYYYCALLLVFYSHETRITESVVVHIFGPDYMYTVYSLGMFHVIACFPFILGYNPGLPRWYNALTEVDGKKVTLKFLVGHLLYILGEDVHVDVSKMKRLVCHGIYEKCTCTCIVFMN